MNSKLKLIWIFSIGFITIFPLVVGGISYNQIRSNNVLVRVANYTMNEMDFSFGSWGKGIMMEGLLHAYNLTSNADYLNFVKYWTDYSIRTQTNNGIFSHGETTVGDSSIIGISVLYFYELTNDTYYLNAAIKNKDYLFTIPPRTVDGGLSHRQSNLELWIDTVHMICPFLAKLGVILNDSDIIDEAVNQIIIHDKYLRDSSTHLYSHIWTWNGINEDPYLWSRGIGWMTTAIVDLLSIIPNTHSNYTYLIDLLQHIISNVNKYQSSSGLWHTIINDTTTALETSCTELFAYSIAKALQNSWIEDENNKTIAINAYNAVINKVNDIGIVMGVSGGTGWDSYGAPIYIRAISWGQGLFMKMYKLFHELGW
ncbi:MAG: glycoside hydrolase family 88/105 protein [Candidatus Helarchaeota archaeon]